MLKFSGWSCLISDAKKVCVTKHWKPKLHASTLNEFTLWEMWRQHWAHLQERVYEDACRAQSAFLFNKRRVSLALRFGWGENKTLKQACRLENQPAPVAFKNLMTHGSAIRIAYRTSLRSSSLWEPRYPSLRIWFLWLSLVSLLCLN
jgi:hypothetical protein